MLHYDFDTQSTEAQSSRIRTVEMKTLRYLVFCPDSWSLGSHVLN